MRYLRQMGYAPAEVGFGVVQVEDGTLEDELTLARRLLIWSQVNNGEAQIIGQDEHIVSPPSGSAAEEDAVAAHLRDPVREDDPARRASGERIKISSARWAAERTAKFEACDASNEQPRRGS
jgi:hypothetical protein